MKNALDICRTPFPLPIFCVLMEQGIFRDENGEGFRFPLHSLVELAGDVPLRGRQTRRRPDRLPL